MSSETKMRLALAVLTAVSSGSSLAFAHAAGMAMPVRAFLCDSAVHAIQYADMRARGESEEIAKDRVGRAAQAEVCGRYVGIATIETETVTLSGGVAYRVTSFRFREDKRLAWLAETSFAPTPGSWAL